MKILVRGTNWIGDAVMTVPALKELRRGFPKADITLQTRRAAADVFEDADFIDRLIPIKDGGSRFASILGQAREIRPERFDVGIILTNSIEAAIVQRLGGVARRFGYATQRRSAFLTDALSVPTWKDVRHEVYYYLNLIESIEKQLGREPRPSDTQPYPELTVSRLRRAAARKMLDEYGVRSSRPLIALGVGSTNSRAKRWPAERFAALATLLVSKVNADILLIGSAGDKAVADEVKRLAQADLIDLCGMTGVGEAAAILAECDLLIANDMGLAHLAPAVGTKTIVIFGPTNDVTTRPMSEHAEVIRHHVECSPCMLRDCPIDHRCMTGVAVESVLDRASARLLSK
jgi:heptosyltransferase II